jgi:death on curing protein
VRYVSLGEILDLYSRMMAQTGGAPGVRDLSALESALAQPRMTFGDADLYSTIEEKAAALGFSLIANHPFVDGNKRIGHAALEVFLLLNGYELDATVDDAEQIIIGIAAGANSRDDLLRWVRKHSAPSRGV